MQVLLIDRKFPPFLDVPAFPGGFLNQNEDSLDAVIRELKEETSIELPVGSAIRLSTRKKIGRDPRGPTQTVPYLFYVDYPIATKAKDDALKADWIYLKDLGELAFDHGAILCEALSRFYSYMPLSEAKLTSEVYGCNTNKNTNTEEIVFFGGSFNPWHDGHKACIDNYIEINPNITLLVVPDSNPFKKDTFVEGCIWVYYQKMLSHLKETSCGLYPGFCGLEVDNPTVKWLPHVNIKKRSMLLGQDSFCSFPHWQDSQILSKALSEIYIIPRNVVGDMRRTEALNWFKSSAPHIKLTFLKSHSYQSVSSSAIKEKL